MNRIPVILDGDPGHDDAIAWLLALAHEELDVRAVIPVSGNVSLEKTTYNTLRILTLLGRTDIPVAPGAAKPLLELPSHAPSVHGESGLDGPALPEPVFEVCGMTGVELMAKVLRESRQKVTIVPTGALTNVAALLTAYPTLKRRIKRIVLMGGGILSGNWTPAAEFNILIDPEAAKIVFESGVPIVMAPLDVTEKALVFPEDFERIRALGNPVSSIVAEWLDFFYKFHLTIGYKGAPLHDPCAVGYLLKPEMFVTREMYVEIETSGMYCKGVTVGDVRGVSGKKPNATVMMNLDRQAFVDLLVDACARYGGEVQKNG